MKFTVRLDKKLLAEAKRHADRSGKTLSSLVEEAVRESLAHRRRHEKSNPVRLKTVKGDGVRAGVNLGDSAALFDLMGT